MADDDGNRSGDDENEAPKRRKRAPMYYKTYLQKGESERSGIPSSTVRRWRISKPGSSSTAEEGSQPMDAERSGDEPLETVPPAVDISNLCSAAGSSNVPESPPPGDDLNVRDANPDCQIDDNHPSAMSVDSSSSRGCSDASSSSDESQSTSDSETSSDSGERSDESSNLPEETPPRSCDLDASEEANLNRAKSLRDKHKLDKIIPLDQITGRSVVEILVLCLSYAMRHGLNDVAIQGLLTLINNIAGAEIIPQSLWLFKNIFRYDCGVDYHFYCSECELYLGCYSDLKGQKSVTCPVSLCRKVCNVSAMNDGHFFVSLPLGPQLKCFLESRDDIAELLAYRFTRDSTENAVRDIFDGLLYKEHVKDGGILSDVDNFSITINTDGAPIFRSTNNSIWPIQCRANFLPPNVRFNRDNMFIAGIWFGKGHPNMNVFFSQFAAESRRLHSEGFLWTMPNKGVVCSKVVTLNTSLDSVAKADAQKMTHCNGYDSCGYCEHPGHLVNLTNDVLVPLPQETGPSGVAVGNVGDPDDPDVESDSDHDVEAIRGEPVIEGRPTGNEKVVKQVRYTYSRGGTYPDRTDEGMRELMAQSETEKRVIKGVKGLSPFALFFAFHLVYGFVIDYMHAVLLGVTKQMLSLWLESKFRGKDFSIRGKEKEIDQRLLKLMPPLSISRRPQSVKDYTHWKANQFRAWLLYYCLPCLTGILPEVHLEHLSLLVSSIYILTSDCISYSSLDAAHDYLLRFVKDFETLYGPSQMTYNVHLLTHMCQCVRSWGPLWAYSAFSFETGNGVMKNMVKGTRGVMTQITSKYVTYRFLPKILSIYEISDSVIDMCDNLLLRRRQSNVASSVSKITFPDAPITVAFSEEEKELLVRANIPTVIYPSFERMIIDSVMYHSRQYRRQGKKSFDSAVVLDDKSFGIIERIFVQEREPANGGGKRVLIVLKSVNLERQAPFVNGECKSHIIACDWYPFGDVKLVNAKKVAGKAIYLKTGLRSYMTVFSNRFEKD